MLFSIPFGVKFPFLNDGQQVNNIKWMLTVVENEVMFDVALHFCLNFDHTIQKLKRRRAVLSSTELQRKKLI